MLQKIILLFFTGFIAFSLNAQSGYWEGTLTQDGKSHKFEMYLKKGAKGKIVGSSSIIINEVIYGLDFSGKMHLDRSVSLWDTTLDKRDLPEEVEDFLRHYQLIYRRSIEGDTLKGYWQEADRHPEYFYKKGKVELRRKQPKA